ncbi:MAG: hypothetical protein RBU21_10075 [FCB group bacterium]|nr:hypothetical protein [FCB group bacterium]
MSLHLNVFDDDAANGLEVLYATMRTRRLRGRFRRRC